jgi:hypothetical protein
MTESPTFVAKFADGEVTRITVLARRDKLDVARGVRLAQHAYRSRTGREPGPIVEACFRTKWRGAREIHRRAASGGCVMTTIREVCWNAIAWIDELTQADADAAVQTLLDRMIAALRRDPRMPTLTGEAWRLLFADAAARSRDELGELIDGRADLGEAVRAIIEALAAEVGEGKRKSRRQADAETGGTP